MQAFTVSRLVFVVMLTAFAAARAKDPSQTQASPLNKPQKEPAQLYRSPLSSIHITIRSDGRMGNGTESDPYDGSTAAAFDSAVNGAPPGAEIFVGTGTYETRGLKLRAGQSLTGSGIDSTVIKLVSAKPFGDRHQHQVIWGVGDGISVQSLTVDIDYSAIGNPPPRVLNSVDLSGDRCLIRRVHAKKPYGLQALYPDVCEGFAVCIQSSSGAKDALIDGCIVDEIRGDAVNGIALIVGKDGVCMPSGVISNCVVRGANWIAYSIWSGVLIGNRAENCAKFWRQDTGKTENLSIINNQVLDCTSPYILEFHPNCLKPKDDSWGQNLLVQGNLLTYSANNKSVKSAIAFYQELPRPGGSFDGVTIQNNVVKYPSGIANPPPFLVVDAQVFKNVVVTGNVSNGAELVPPPASMPYAATHHYESNIRTQK